MSSVGPKDLSQSSSSGPKKKANKKKKASKEKVAEDTPKIPESGKDATLETGDVEGEGDSEHSAVNTPREAAFPENIKLQTNGHSHDSTSNGHAVKPSSQSAKQTKPGTPVGSEEKLSETSDASVRFDAMSQEREALRVEVEQLRKALEDIQGKHTEEMSIIKGQHAQELSSIESKHMAEVTTIKDQHTEEMSTIRAELEETESAKDHAETQYQSLLGRINTIKSSLGERLKADKQELAEAKEQIEELESQNETLQNNVIRLEGEVNRLEQEAHESSKELSSLRNRHNLSQQNWVSEREDFVQQTRQLRDEAEAAKEAMGDWEVLAMEERSMREGLAERIKDLEEQFSVQKEAYEEAVSERDSHSQTVVGLQRALQDVQESRKRELREMVESYEEQLQALKKIVQDADSRATEAEASKGALRTEVDRLIPFEKEIKEKNLLVGKLRHEAIILNDHLTKALRYLKKAKPEDNIDRQIVTNHFLHFLALDRSDPKKFQILQLIASLLNWTDEQKEQAGLSRPGASNSSLRLPMSPFHRTPSTPSLSSEYFTEPAVTTKESLADLWTGFLERSADEASVSGSRSGSVSSSVVRPETKAGEGSSR
ncbi:related to RUD3-suppressor of uso1-1 transport defect [Rhynchosporium secalis]|uniref:Related to RUD3-suppressor of uso1-1 transport defect n=1 Tax=Rhynchosporium secalis TaxID=38038 RepID=A0A1E1M4Z5_RHYSE|nr:related to RUD3-suppressor of uso1-1 transport defect [Rhynchosporium secalis]